MSGENKNDPDWLDAENDDKHRIETEPLLGTGEVSLEDPVDEQQQKKDEKLFKEGEKDEENPFGKNYGSVENESEEGSEVKRNREVVATMPHRPRDNPCLWFFHLLSGVAGVASVCLLATQIIPVILMPAEDRLSKLGVLSIALKMYISVFCLLFLCVEADWPIPFIRTSQLLQVYSSRGFLYSFVALISVEEAYSERLTDLVSSGARTHVGWAPIFMQISSWVMLGIGGLYFVFGLCCLKRLRDKLKKDEQEAWKEYRKDLKAWKENSK